MSDFFDVLCCCCEPAAVLVTSQSDDNPGKKAQYRSASTLQMPVLSLRIDRETQVPRDQQSEASSEKD